MLAERAEKYFQADICMKLLENHVKDQDYIDLVHNRLLRVGVVRRPANIAQEDEQRLQQAQANFNKTQDPVNFVIELILANDLEQACQVATENLTQIYNNLPGGKVLDFFRLLDAIQSVSIAKVKNADVKKSIMFFSEYAGALKAIWHGYAQVLTTFLDDIKEEAKIDREIATFTKELQDQLDAHAESLVGADAHTVCQAPIAHINLQFSKQKTQMRFNSMMEALEQYMKESKCNI